LIKSAHPDFPIRHFSMKLITLLNERFGVAIRDKVISDISQGNHIQPTDIRTAIKIFSIIILATPYLVFVAGCALIYLSYPNIPLLIIGLIILTTAIYLRSPKHLNDQKTLTRTDLPSLFKLLDDISDQLSAPKFDGIHVDSRYNAYATEFSDGQRVLGIGVLLWKALEPSERLAMLAHETAHFTNNDPARGRLESAALTTLSNWVEIFDPPHVFDHETGTTIVIDDRDIIGQVIGNSIGSIFKGLTYIYERFIFADSQRSEYLADIYGASVSGAYAQQAVLKKTILAPLAYQEVSKIFYDGSQQIPIFEIMAKAIHNPDPILEKKLYKEAANTLHTVDSTHPPTRFRMEVVGAASSENATLHVGDYDWQAIETELSDHFTLIEQNFLDALITQ
jgi:Zn-dependent protease with chaperone function